MLRHGKNRNNFCAIHGYLFTAECLRCNPAPTPPEEVAHMATVRVLKVGIDRVHTTFEAAVSPDDEIAAAALLAKTVKAERLGDPSAWRLQVWCQRRGWVEHRIS